MISLQTLLEIDLPIIQAPMAGAWMMFKRLLLLVLVLACARTIEAQIVMTKSVLSQPHTPAAGWLSPAATERLTSRATVICSADPGTDRIRNVETSAASDP